MIWLYLLLGAASAIAIWSLTFARWRWIVQEAEAAILPAGSAPIRVLHISDVHMAPWQHSKQKFIKQLISLRPDLIVNTGDNLGHTEAIAPTLSALAPLLDVPGVFVNGSNDYYAPRFKNPVAYVLKASTPSHEKPLETKAMTDTFESFGWKNLNNNSAEMKVNGLDIAFIGVDDAHDGLDDLDSLARNRKLQKSKFVIGVSHAPYRAVIEEMAEQDAAIVFAGHTHGGQVRFPFIGAVTTNCDLPTKHARGMSAWQFGDRVMLLNVCAGLGNSIFAPIRWFNRPEVRLVTLVAKS
jgi:predicted MPP superfamily phosphohydrolase